MILGTEVDDDLIIRLLGDALSAQIDTCPTVISSATVSFSSSSILANGIKFQADEKHKVECDVYAVFCIRTKYVKEAISKMDQLRYTDLYYLNYP